MAITTGDPKEDEDEEQDDDEQTIHYVPPLAVKATSDFHNFPSAAAVQRMVPATMPAVTIQRGNSIAGETSPMAIWSIIKNVMDQPM